MLKLINKHTLAVFVSAITLISVFGQSNVDAGVKSEERLYQSARKIPLVKSCDVVVVGGSVAAVSAAVSAAENGAKVFLIAPRLYLGEDMCATLRLQIDESRELKTELEKQIFGDDLVTTPLKVKATLNDALMKANVDFVFGSFVTDLLYDKSGGLAGLIMTNRAGRQAIISKTIIDATDRGWVSCMAGATSEPWNDGEIEFERVIVMEGETEETPAYRVERLLIPMYDLNFTSFANAEQLARKKTYKEDQLRASESLFHIPPDPIICEKNGKDWKDRRGYDMDHFRPKGFRNLFVLSGSAGIPRAIASKLLQPAAFSEVAALVGTNAAQISSQKKDYDEVNIHSIHPNSEVSGNVGENLMGLRPIKEKYSTINCPESSLPVLAEYDVVVVGGGTSGAPAAIAVARQGKKVLVVEYQEGLGGVGTLGFIGKPYHGRKVGFAAEVPFPSGNIEPKMEWYREEIAKHGGDIWLGVLGSGAYVDKNKVIGAVVITPQGRGVIKAKVVIDATGSGDIAIAAGAEYMYGDIEKDDIALQGTGLPSRPLKGNYLNTDYLMVDEADMVDIWRTLVSVQQTKFSENVYDAGSLIQNRERRRIVGDYTLSYLDQVIGRTFPDAIVYSASDYDSHGYPSSSFFAMLPHDEESRKLNHPAPGGTCYTPYRCLLPKGIEGILVTGLGISMDRDASAMIRMQLDLANQGYAAGTAAVHSISDGVSLREIDIKELQRQLIDLGNLPEEVIDYKDSFPLPYDSVQQAVEAYGISTNPETAGRPLAIILTHQDISIPLIIKKYHSSEGRSKLLYAQVLGMCGNTESLPTLLAELDNFVEWDDKIYQGWMADYAHLPTPIDALILSVGYSGIKDAPVQLLNLVEKLDNDVTLSHHRSLALALESIGDQNAAKSLAMLLQKPMMQGHAMLDFEDAMTGLSNNGTVVSRRATPVQKRTRALREITISRALFKCGDYEGTGQKILETYSNDMRGLFARHANAILNAKNEVPSGVLKIE